MCRIHIHVLSTHSVLLDILTVINTLYTLYVHILHYVYIYTHTIVCGKKMQQIYIGRIRYVMDVRCMYPVVAHRLLCLCSVCV